MAATGEEMVRENKNSSRSGKCQGILFYQRSEETFWVKWVQRTAVIGGWRPLPYLTFCIFHLDREIYILSGKSQGILKTDVCGNHDNNIIDLTV